MPATDEFKEFAAGSRGRLLDTMLREIATKQPQQVLISTEEFIRFGGPHGVPQEVAARLIDDFDADSVQIVCYLRRPDRYLEAWYNQLIKAGRSPKRLARNLDRFMPTVHVQFAKAVAYWAELPGVTKVTLRRYEEAASDLLNDVTAAFEAPDLGSARKTASQSDLNLRLPDQFVEFARRANKAGGRSRRRNTILTDLAADPDIASVPVYFLDLAARERLLEEFRPIDERLASLAGTGSTFFADLDEMVDIDPAAISDREAFQRWRGVAEAATRDRLTPPRQPTGVG